MSVGIFQFIYLIFNVVNLITTKIVLLAAQNFNLLLRDFSSREREMEIVLYYTDHLG
jgi:hypothetical protein